MSKTKNFLEKLFDVLLIVIVWGLAVYLLIGLLMISAVDTLPGGVTLTIIGCGFFVIITFLIKYTIFWWRRWQKKTIQ